MVKQKFHISLLPNNWYGSLVPYGYNEFMLFPNKIIDLNNFYTVNVGNYFLLEVLWSDICDIEWDFPIKSSAGDFLGNDRCLCDEEFS